MDAAYKTPWISKRIIDDGRTPSLPCKRSMTKKGYYRSHEYVYDEYYDQIICPENRLLDYSTTNRHGQREYKSKWYQCKECPSRSKCTQSKEHTKLVYQHIFV